MSRKIDKLTDRTAQDFWLYDKCCGDTKCIFAAFIFLHEKR